MTNNHSQCRELRVNTTRWQTRHDGGQETKQSKAQCFENVLKQFFFFIVDIMFLCWQWIDGVSINDSFYFRYWNWFVFCLRNLRTTHWHRFSFFFTGNTAWNLAWYMFDNDIARPWSKIIEKWGTRRIFILLNMTYILSPF